MARYNGEPPGAADGDGENGKEQLSELARLKELFKDADPIEVLSIDLASMTPREIVGLLPRFTAILEQGGNPAFGILIDSRSGRAWALRSGLSPHKEQVINGIRYRNGTLTRRMLAAAGDPWGGPLYPLGAHIEAQAAALFWKCGLTDAVLVINAVSPCTQNGKGCLYRLPGMLPAGASLTVYNKNGRQFVFAGERS